MTTIAAIVGAGGVITEGSMKRATVLFDTLILATAPLPALAAGIITGLTASPNPAQVSQDVTFTVKGTSGGCGDLTIDFGDGQTIQLTSVSFNNNTNTTTPAHKYPVAKTYLVKATPGRSCSGSASVSLNVTGGGAGGTTGGVAGRMSRMARQAEANLIRARSPRIDSVFPFSMIQPGGGVLVQGVNFGPSTGKFLLKLQEGQSFEMGGLTWADNAVSGNIEPGIGGVLDQPATLQVIRADGSASNEVTVQFTARREIRLLPMADVQCSAEDKTDVDTCNDRNDPNSPDTMTGFHQCRDVADWVFGCNDSGVDAFWTTLANGWKVNSAILTYVGGGTAQNPPTIAQGGPGPVKVTVWWDTRDLMVVRYIGRVFIEGPAGTSHK